MFEISPLVLALTPILIGLVEGLKASGMNSRYAFPASIILGVVLAWLVLLPEAISGLTVLQGLVLGLSASGLYSGGKKLLEK